MGGDEGPTEGADQHAGRDALADIQADGAMGVVRPQAGDRSNHDARHRGTERDMHQMFARETLGSEHGRENRHHDAAAPDAEQPGEKPDEGPEHQIGQ